MCGIAGLLHFDPARKVDPALLDRMTDALAHRGPDGRGTHVDGPCGLGHRRLAIVDLSPDGANPMPNEDGSVWVVLNGEIYDFGKLRAELEGRGHRLRSRTDTEVIVHLYEEVGDAVVDRLRGMFAFALWDGRKRRLLLARDRFGKKPLFYRLHAGGVAFGSELKAILEDPSVPRTPDRQALAEYLSFGYVNAPRTAFEGLSSLPPGHTLAIEQDGRASLRRYWSLPVGDARPLAGPGGEERAVEQLAAAVDEAVRIRMVADVPLGAFLSGGLDSSSIVASMVAASPRGAPPPRTFAIGFDEPAFDERAHAERVARHLGTDHETLVLRPEDAAPLERIAWHHDQPLADSSSLPTFAVSRLARRRVTVALSGDGGDELLLGYDRYRGAEVELQLRRTPAALQPLLRSRTLIHLLHLTGRARRVVQELTHERLTAGSTLDESYAARVEVFRPEQLAAVAGDLVGPGSREPVARLVRASHGGSFSERCAHADVESYLPGDILAKVDRASMAYALEVRCPLLDHVLAEQIARLPVALKLRRLQGKVALRRAVAHRLPPSTLARKKQGFGAPLARWFRAGLQRTLEEVLLDPRALSRGVTREAGVRALLDEHARGIDHEARLYALVMLELWFRQWIDPPPGRLEARPVLAAAGA